MDAGADERSTARGALRGKRGGGDETGATASGGAPFKRRAKNRGRGKKWGGGSGGEDAMRCGAGVGPGPDQRVAPRPCPDRSRPGRGARGRRMSVSGRGAPRAADAWPPAGNRRGREERGVGGVWAGLEEKGLGRARRKCDV
jgi:hypothetical protein